MHTFAQFLCDSPLVHKTMQVQRTGHTSMSPAKSTGHTSMSPAKSTGHTSMSPEKSTVQSTLPCLLLRVQSTPSCLLSWVQSTHQCLLPRVQSTLGFHLKCSSLYWVWCTSYLCPNFNFICAHSSSLFVCLPVLVRIVNILQSLMKANTLLNKKNCFRKEKNKVQATPLCLLPRVQSSPHSTLWCLLPRVQATRAYLLPRLQSSQHSTQACLLLREQSTQACPLPQAGVNICPGSWISSLHNISEFEFLVHAHILECVINSLQIFSLYFKSPPLYNCRFEDTYSPL